MHQTENLRSPAAESDKETSLCERCAGSKTCSNQSCLWFFKYATADSWVDSWSAQSNKIGGLSSGGFLGQKAEKLQPMLPKALSMSNIHCKVATRSGSCVFFDLLSDLALSKKSVIFWDHRSDHWSSVSLVLVTALTWSKSSHLTTTKKSQYCSSSKILMKMRARLLCFPKGLQNHFFGGPKK